ncbi:MAG: phospholipase A [Pseudomonadota bacterium]
MRNHSLIAVFLFYTAIAIADDNSATLSKEQQCMETAVAGADESMTIKALKEACSLLVQQGRDSETIENIPGSPDITTSSSQAPTLENAFQLETTPVSIPTTKNNVDVPQVGLLKNRLTIEALNRSNRFILVPHKRNYLLPVSYTNKPNEEPYRKADTTFTNLNHTEAELQLSVKILLHENLIGDNGHLYLGYTNHSLWQVYNRNLSAPFRESDHEPELILSFTNNWEILGFNNAVNEIIINHESNGQTGLLSRSWNRIMFMSVFEKGDFAFTINPWYRLPESRQKYPGDPRGDDNPDISKYMGHGELSAAYKYKSNIFNIQIRHNLDSDYGAVELGWTFPVTKNIRGIINYFDGYGHSLIDYNVHQRNIGLGIIFTDLF